MSPYRQSERQTPGHKIVRLLEVFSPILSREHRDHIWDDYDYSAPSTEFVGYIAAGEIVGEIKRRYPGVLVQLPDGRTGWINEWDLRRL